MERTPRITLPPRIAPLRRLPGDRLLGSIAIVGVLLGAVFGPNLSQPTGGSGGGGSALRQSLYLLTFMIAIASIRPWQSPARLLVLPLSMIAILAWSLFSISWSVVPATALRRFLLTVIVIWTVFLAVRCAGYDRTILLFRRVMIAILVGNLLAVALLPGIAIHQAATVADPGLIGAWRGLLAQKNFAGAVAAVTILIFFFDANHMPRYMRWGTITLSILFLLGTQSKTSMGICLGALAIGWLFGRYNPGYRLFFLPALLILGAGAFVLIDMEGGAVIDHFMRDRYAFTGRVEIWIPLIDFASDNPFTGSGYGSFWNIGDEREPIKGYAKGWVTGQASGHNGFLDVLVQVGLPGLFLVLLAYLIMPLWCLITSQTIARPTASLLMALIFFCIGHNATESSLLDRDVTVHVFLLFTIALVHLTTKPRPRQSGVSGYPALG